MSDTETPSTRARGEGPLRLPGFVDDRRPNRFQLDTVLLCGLVMFLDGFDTQAINYMAPAITEDWGLSKADLGPIFSAALAGLMIGYLVLSPLADRYGHKRLVVGGATLFALTTFASAWARDPGQLLLLRFITGMGLGAATPSTIALTAEYSPKRVRASFVLAIYCGFSLGFVVANYVADALIRCTGGGRCSWSEGWHRCCSSWCCYGPCPSPCRTCSAVVTPVGPTPCAARSTPRCRRVAPRRSRPRTPRRGSG